MISVFRTCRFPLALAVSVPALAVLAAWAAADGLRPSAEVIATFGPAKHYVSNPAVT